MKDYQIKSIKGNCAVVYFQGREMNISLRTAKNWITMKKTDPEDYAVQIRRFEKIVHAIESHL